MTSYPSRIPDSLVESAEESGFVRTADIVPSAIGLPVSTGMTQEEYDATVETVLDLAVDEGESIHPVGADLGISSRLDT